MSKGGKVFREDLRRFKRDVASCTADFRPGRPLSQVCLSVIEAHEIFCLGIRLVRRWDTPGFAVAIAEIKADMKRLQTLASQVLPLLSEASLPSSSDRHVQSLKRLTLGDEWWLRNSRIVDPLRKMAHASATEEQLAVLEQLPPGRVTRQKWLTDKSVHPSWTVTIDDPRFRRFRN